MRGELTVRLRACKECGAPSASVNLPPMAKKSSKGPPPEAQQTKGPGSSEKDRVKGAVADILGQLSPDQLRAFGAFADSVSTFPFPEDPYAETRKDIAEAEDRLQQEIEASGGDT